MKINITRNKKESHINFKKEYRPVFIRKSFEIAKIHPEKIPEAIPITTAKNNSSFIGLKIIYYANPNNT
ncbi:MAG: hypothetical protein WC812_01435 [Candidatus Pacearchaeota archaeon]|jgi:hypothetical protein